MLLKALEHNALTESGVIFKTIFKDGTAIATDVEPAVDLLFPGISALYNASATAAAKISSTWVTGKGSKAQPKSATSIQVFVIEITPAFNAYAASQGLPAPTSAQITAWAKAFFTLLVTVPASPASTSSASSTKS
jgi:hypothetical protein